MHSSVNAINSNLNIATVKPSIRALLILHSTDIRQIQIISQLKKVKEVELRLKNRGPCRFRTDDPRIKSPLLYRLS